MLTKEENAVYSLIANSETKITQLQIARSATWLGCHPEHEAYEHPKESTLRQVRQIIRDLRIKHGIPILSAYGKDGGYWVMKYPDEANKYIATLEKMAKAQSKAWFETYSQMKKNFGVRSDYFDKQGNLFNNNN